MNPSRRHFIQQMMAGGLSLPWAFSPLSNWGSADDAPPLAVHLFSKHLQFLDVGTAAEMAAEMGFAGLDLTVRPKGHILPENVRQDLPGAIRAIEAAGSKVEMITTAVEDIARQSDLDVLTAASQAGVRYYRCNWFRYAEDQPMSVSLAYWREEVRKLAAFNTKHGLTGCYQNHAGTKIGASYWEIEQLLAGIEAESFGVQYDIRHATAEGGLSWENGLRLLHPRIKTIVLKDFKWEKVNGQWRTVNVPIGQGMVDFNSYFSLLKAYKIQVPVSLHLEYPLGGVEKGAIEITVDKKVIFDAMRADLQRIRQLWREA